MTGLIGPYSCLLRERPSFENVDLTSRSAWRHGLPLLCIAVAAGDSARIISVDNLGISAAFPGFVQLVKSTSSFQDSRESGASRDEGQVPLSLKLLTGS